MASLEILCHYRNFLHLESYRKAARVEHDRDNGVLPSFSVPNDHSREIFHGGVLVGVSLKTVPPKSGPSASVVP
jgi:hypothetical protein